MTEVVRHHPMAKCEECPLYGAAYVEAVMPENGKPTIALVGEFPSFNDIVSGSALGGPSGQLLVKVLEHHGISKNSTYRTNSLGCHPPDPQKVPKAAIKACEPRIISQLQDSNVGTVVTFGALATEMVLGKSGIKSLRAGPPKHSDNLPGIRIIPTLHPGMALRSADSFPFLVTDIKKINTEYLPWIDPIWTLADDESTAVMFLSQLEYRKPEFVVIDIETNIEKDTDFGHADQHGMLCVGIAYDKKKVLVVGEEAMKSPRVHQAMLSFFKSTKLVAHNGKFDLPGLVPVLGELLPLWYDTMIGSYVLDERSGIHSLGYIGSEFHGAPDWKDEVKKYTSGGKGYGNIPREKLYPYNATDCSVTYDEVLRQHALFARPENKGLRELHDFIVHKSGYLARLEKNGLAIDMRVLDDLDVEYTDTLRGLQFAVEALLMETFNKSYAKIKGDDRIINLDSWQQITEALADFGVTTDSTDEKHITGIREKLQEMNMMETPLGEFIDIISEQRKVSTAKGTFVDGIRSRMYEGKVHTSYLLHGTWTGRLSSRNPNVQNIPREKSIRSLFVPEHEDNVLIQCDYAQAELRIMSWLAKDVYFRDIFMDPSIDVFDDLTPELWTDVSKDTTAGPVWKEFRTMTKTFVYGLAYGRTEYGIAAAFKDLSIDDAKLAKDRFFAKIPEIVEFFDDVKRRVLRNEDLVTPFGRRRRFALISKENRREVMNQSQAFIPQSTASDMCLRALTWVQDEIDEKHLPAKIVNIIHDAILVDAHHSVAEEVKEILERNMFNSGDQLVNGYVPMAVDASIGKSWGEL